MKKNTVETIALHWQKHHDEEKLDLKEGRPWGLQWGGTKIITSVNKRIGKYIKGDVLEIGCGGGKWTKWLCDKADSVCAIDVHQTALDESEKYEPRAQYKLGNGETIPYEDGRFDTVFTWDVLLHLPMPLVQKYFNEARRVCKGYFVFGLPDLESDAGKESFARAVAAARWRNPYSYGYMTHYAPQLVEQMLFIAGFKSTIPQVVGTHRDRIYIAGVTL